ncbi:ABC transporter permease [Gudongella sp. DL1XJH-153]|uniref:ABC transporter permease n=1 Tax=Gudongella sp. DL1XJH-153 TaxID=3409804 RepID=UPI003BB5653D
MRLALKIALRFLKSGRGQTILIVLGISIGVSVQLFIGSLIQGLQINLIDTTIGSSSQVTITSTTDDKLIDNWDRTVYEAKMFEPEVTNVSVSADGPATLDYEADTAPVLIRGFDIEDSNKIYNIEEGLYEGRLPGRKDEVLIGRELAQIADVSSGDRILVLNPGGGSARFDVTGLYDLQVSSINESWIITNLQTAQDFLGMGNKVSSIEMQVSQVFDADAIGNRIGYAVSDPNLRVDNWKDQNQSLLSGLNGQSVSSYMIQIFVLVAVLLGISSVLAISVVQRSKQLGILKAMGIKDREASLIFVFQGLMLGILGAIMGIAFGFGLLYSFTKFAVNPDGTPVVPIYINYGFIALSGVFAIVSAMIASLIPARISSRLNPIEVIKNG